MREMKKKRINKNVPVKKFGTFFIPSWKNQSGNLADPWHRLLFFDFAVFPGLPRALFIWLTKEAPVHSFEKRRDSPNFGNASRTGDPFFSVKNGFAIHP